MTKNLIELNGNVYDTSTGKLITSNAPINNSSSAQRKPQNHAISHASIDGFAKRKPSGQTPMRQPAPAKKSPAKSQTLMRSAVSKPEPAPQASTQNLRQPIKKQPRIDIRRFERASKVQQSTAIQKFPPHVVRAGEQKQEQARPPINTTQQAKQQENNPAPVLARHNVTSAQQQAPPINTSSSFTTENALRNARSHEETYNEKKSGFFSRAVGRLTDTSKTAKYGLTALIAIVAVLTLSYFVAPRASMQVASTRSGISASLPSYTPAGFQLNRSIDYSDGQVSFAYNSVSDDRNFRITKEKTDWNNDVLRTNFVEQKGIYQTISNNGKVIYVYNTNNATWIDGGIRYTIEGASSLSSDQLLRIANSL